MIRKYGIDAEGYAQILSSQEFCCAICGVHESESRGRNPGRLVVDHDHETGRVRGLLCSPCNTAMGLMADSPELLRGVVAALAERQR